MKVPIRGGDQRMSNMPGVRVGNYADASHFGANRYRDLYNMAGAAGKLGNSILAEAQRRQEDEDRTEARLAINDAHVRLADQEKIVQDQYKGNRATEFPAEMDKLTKQIRGNLSAKLKNQNQRKFFDEAMNALEAKTRVGAIQYRDQQMEAAKQSSLDNQNGLLTREASRMVTAPGGIKAVLSGPQLAMIDDNIRAKFDGYGQETIQAEIRKARGAFHTAQMDALALDNPRLAANLVRKRA